MKYVIDKKNNYNKLMYYNVKINGLTIEPVNKSANQPIKAKSITLVDPMLREVYVKKRINKKIDKIVAFMIKILNDEDTGEDDTGLVLDEVARIRSVINNKYREFITMEEYKSLIGKLIIVEEEFKRNYNRKSYSYYSEDSYYIEEPVSGMSR